MSDYNNKLIGRQWEVFTGTLIERYIVECRFDTGAGRWLFMVYKPMPLRVSLVQAQRSIIAHPMYDYTTLSLTLTTLTTLTFTK